MPDSIFIHNSHNVSNFCLQFCMPNKISSHGDNTRCGQKFKANMKGIRARYDWVTFLEIGTNQNHVHFLIWFVPEYSPTIIIIIIIKCITTKHIFAEYSEVKKALWGGIFWNSVFLFRVMGKNK